MGIYAHEREQTIIQATIVCARTLTFAVWTVVGDRYNKPKIKTQGISLSLNNG